RHSATDRSVPTPSYKALTRSGPFAAFRGLCPNSVMRVKFGILFVFTMLLSRPSLAAAQIHYRPPLMHIGEYTYPYTVSGIHELCYDHPLLCNRSPAQQAALEQLETHRTWLYGSLVGA